MSSNTHRNWHALQAIALKYLKELRQRNPGWRFDDLAIELDLPRTALFFEMAAKVGFTHNTDPTSQQVCAVAQMLRQGVWSELTIASELGIPVQTVREIFESYGKGYGNVPYGVSAYDGNRKFSDGKGTVPRRISTSGQLKYRNRTYTLGAAYRGRNALVREQGDRLLVMFADCPPLHLTRRA